MEFHVHYQEKTDARILTNVIMTLDELFDMYGDEFIMEHIMNHVGEWWENGITQNDETLFVRINYIVSAGNLEDYKARVAGRPGLLDCYK